MPLSHSFVLEAKKMLLNVDAWLEKAAKYAEEKKFDKEVLLQARLAPDAYSLLKQIQTIADGAKLMAARLSGKDAPVHTDDEKTYDEARARLKKSIAFIDTLTEKDFEGAEARTIVLAFMPTEKKGIKGNDYLAEFSAPNFFFHVVTAYQILRHNGVPLGKMDYIGSMNMIAV
jgi:hypothetical protein